MLLMPLLKSGQSMFIDIKLLSNTSTYLPLTFSSHKKSKKYRK